jgi:hypothetical protein
MRCPPLYAVGFAAPLLLGDAAALADALPLADVEALLDADPLAEALPLADELVPPPPPHAVNANNPAIPALLFNNCRREICLDMKTPFVKAKYVVR